MPPGDETTDFHPADAQGRRAGDKDEDTGEPLPALRAVPAEMVSTNPNRKGQPSPEEMAIMLRDPDGFAPSPALLTPLAYALANLFDGERSAEDVAEAFRDQYAHEVPLQAILELRNELDGAMFLDSPRFQDHVRKTLLRYLGSPRRPTTHAGMAYPDDPDELLKTVEGWFRAKDGPGLPDSLAAKRDTIRGMIVPHIDPRVGGSAYAHGYRALLEDSQADLFVILGVGHRCSADTLFNVSTKDFNTPFGPAKNMRGISRRLQEASGIDSAVSEYAHKDEFSIEFQAVFLQTILHEMAGRDFEIVPILCGPCEPFLEEEQNPAQDDGFLKFAEALRKELDKTKRKWCVMASVDFSHVGPKFGHTTNMTERLMLPVERADRRMIQKIETLDPDAFYFEIARTKNSRHVDAVMAVLALLSVGKGTFTKSRLLAYRHFFEEPTKSAVTFASMALE